MSIISKNPTVIAFKGINFFNINFNISNWHLTDIENEIKNTADCFFQINVKKHKTRNSPEYQFIEKSKKPVMVCESNLFRKNSYPISDSQNCYFRLGWNHFLRCGNFNNQNSPSDRWTKIKKLQNLEVKDWRKNGNHILLVLQKPGDSTLNSLYKNYKNYHNWIQDTINQIRKHSDREILIRPHLLTTKLNYWQFESNVNKVSISKVFRDRTNLEGGKSLEKDLENAWAVVGYNSNSMVESTLAGIPTFPLDYDSIIWDISNKNLLKNLENPDIDIDRTQWCYDAGYMIWSKEEIRHGVAWNHLKGVYFD